LTRKVSHSAGDRIPGAFGNARIDTFRILYE
jgi:hypothetical protein